MSHDTILRDILIKQEHQINAFERHRADMLKAVQDTETELLREHGCTLKDAPPHLLAIITKLRDDYQRHWSGDGLLFSELLRRQYKTRQRVLTGLQNRLAD